MGLDDDATPGQRLHAFVRSFLFRIFDEGRPAWHGKLMAREIADPTAALDGIVDEGVKPHFALIKSIVIDLLGPGAAGDADRVRYCAWSVVAQCLFYFHARPVIMRLYPAQQFGPQDIEAIARHVTDFSLAAMKQMRHLPAGDEAGKEPRNGHRRSRRGGAR